MMAVYVLLIIISIIWGGSFVVVKEVLPFISPINLAFLRFFISSSIMLILLFLSKKSRAIAPKDIGWVSLLGLTGVTLLYLLQYTGIYYTNASSASILINTNVIFIALLASLFLREKIGMKRAFGIFIAFIGVIFVTSINPISDGNFIIGGILVILSGLCWAVYSIIGKYLMRRYDDFTLNTYAFALGTLFFLPFLDYKQMETLTISPNLWFALFYLSILSTVLGYTVWYYSLSKMDASKTAVFLNLIPLSAMLFSVVFLNEMLTPQFLIGALLILFGVYITQKG